jgi:RHS repeat-associated protein
LFLIALVLISVGLVTKSASAQVATGTPPFSSVSGGPDAIDLANLNSHITIPVLHKPGRGMDFTYDLTFDSSVWFPSLVSGVNTWTPDANWGWRAQTEVILGYVSYTLTITICNVNNRKGMHYLYSNWTYHDGFGSPHHFNGATDIFNGTCGTGTSQLSTTAIDGSGYHLNATGSQVSLLTAANGKVINAPLGTQSGAGSQTDRNGNQINATIAGVFTDTLGTSALTAAGSGTPASPVSLTYTAPSGANAAYTISYKTYTVRTNYGCPGIAEFDASGTAQFSLVDKVTLPDLSFYQFSYETTPLDTNSPHHVTGRLASVILPTGGTINYTYTGGSSGITCADGSASGLTRQTPDGSWSYARTPGSGAAYTTTITDPSTPTANQTVIQFQGIYETQRQVYQGSTSGTLLKTTNTCYNGSSSPCAGTAVVLPITQIAQVSIVPGTNNLQSKRVALYNTYGLVTELDEYDFGSGAPPSTPLRKTLTSYAALGNGIVSMPASVTVKDGSNNVKAQTTFTYDQGTPVASSGTPQHVGVSGSRGNVTTIASLTQGSSTLNQTLTYYDTGMVQTLTDVNGATTTYNYSNATASCGNAFPTSVSEPLSLLKYMTWKCSGGVQLTSVDENNQTVTTTWNDPDFWRPASVTDQLTYVTSFSYSASTPAWTSQALVFNGNQSIVQTGIGFDGLGRAIIQNRQQAPSLNAWDQVTQSYDSNGRPWKTSAPCVNTGAWTCPITAKTITYDPLNRPHIITDGGGGTITYSYPQNDVLVEVGPAPTGENTKRRQLEYDALGRLTSVCEVTSGTGSGTCGQYTTQTGFWTKYTYDALGNLTGVTQNAQSTGSQQTRTYAYDMISRLTSETNPESGTKTYFYDSDSTMCGNGAYTSHGDLVKTSDAAGNCVMGYYDTLHRLTDVGNSAANPCKRFRYDNSSGYLGSTKPAGLTNTLGRLIEAATDACSISGDPIVSDEWFSYTARGEVSDLYESTPHSGGYYHTTATYWANGVVNQMTGPGGYATAYNLDGEGRVYSTPVSVWALSSTAYNAASQSTQVTFAPGDSDTFTYDTYTNRMTQYKFTVNGQSVIGNLTWNPIGTLASLAITDPFNGANAQTCNYSHDDLTRIASANCGSAANQTFSYDAFGNINKSGSPYSFQPTYNSSTNRMASISGSTPTYDASGNVLNDFLHSYTWDAYGRPVTIDGVSVTYDALGRMAEQNKSGAYSEIVYAPTGTKIEIMSGQSFTRAFLPLPGGAVAVWGGGNAWYRHSDHLGSSRFASTQSRTMYSDVAYAPFGEPYAQTGSTDLSFTGMNQDTVSNLYDFPAREYGIQGRWPSPDPAGLATVDPSSPQSWNRYAYVLNSPLEFVDPLGLGPHCRSGDPRPECHGPGCLNPNAGCFGGPACWAVTNGASCTNPGDLNATTCTIDGVASSCSQAYGLLGTGAAYPILGPDWKFKGDLTYGSNCYVNTVVDSNPICLGDIHLQATGALDDRANALAHAVNNTGVQAMGNPCTYAAWYSASVGGALFFSATPTGATVFPATNKAIETLAIAYFMFPKEWREAAAWALAGATYAANRGVNACRSLY